MEFMQRKRIYNKDKTFTEITPGKIGIWKFGDYPDFEPQE